MPEIIIPRKALGKRLTDAIKIIGDEIGFRYYDFDNKVFLSKEYPEHVPEHLRCCLDVTPYLSFRFGKIDPQKDYTSFQCETMIGTMEMEPINLEYDDSQEGYWDVYNQEYDQFKERLVKYLS